MKFLSYRSFTCFIYFILLFFIQTAVFADNHSDVYLVYFTDKDEVNFDPEEYFHPLAIERRVKNDISLYEYSDFPVREDYKLAVSSLVDSISYVSRWFNAVFVYGNETQIDDIKLLNFVENVEKLEPVLSIPASINSDKFDLKVFESEREKLMKLQLRHLNGREFYDRRVNGSGVRIAIFDAGFPGVNIHAAFSKIVNEKRIVDTWDFHKNIKNVFKDNKHGTNVMSAIGGYYDTIPLGLATGAEFLLARTEIWLEKFYEEEYWLAAAEWADRNGAHIINSSVGYTYHRYFPEQMDGETSLVARAAGMAAEKGILVVVAAGNEGNKDNWQTICTPADAKGILSVGALDPNTAIISNYSSRGPTADKRLKPNVSAYGTVVAASERGYAAPSGTSFASPLIAGFAACVMQLNPEWNKDKVIQEIQKSASLHPYYDYAHGYGVPDANYFLGQKYIPQNPTFKFNFSEENVIVEITDIATYNITSNLSSNILYAHIADQHGQIINYFVVDVYQQNAFTLDFSQIPEGHKLLVHYKGYTDEFQPF